MLYHASGAIIFTNSACFRNSHSSLGDFSDSTSTNSGGEMSSVSSGSPAGGVVSEGSTCLASFISSS